MAKSFEELELWLHSQIKTPRYDLVICSQMSHHFHQDIPCLPEEEHNYFWNQYLAACTNASSYSFLDLRDTHISDLHWKLNRDSSELTLWPIQKTNSYSFHGPGGKCFLTELSFDEEEQLSIFLKMLSDFGFVEQDCGTHTEYRKPKT